MEVFILHGNGQLTHPDMSENMIVNHISNMLMHQCESQHKEKDPSFKAHAINMRVDEDTEMVYVNYDNGETWKYDRIEEGSERMFFRKVR